MKLPVVAIVGRPNVGKSSLLNALVGKRISIVQDMPGVTRDQISSHLRVAGHYVELVDTGGYGFVDADQLTDHIRHQIELAMSRADLCLFIVDAQSGLTSADQEIASMLRRRGLKTVIIANKADGPKADIALGEFARLGLGTPIGVSALHARNLDLIPNIVAANLDLADAPTSLPEPEMLVAIVGKRNAGKSTLVNAIAEIFEGHGERVIVSEVPGTTRDSVDVRFEKDGKTLVVIDTAGVRKKRHMVTNDIEYYSFHRAQRSIRRADVVLMLIDGTEHVSEPDKKLAQYIAEQLKPVILVVNKWDKVLEGAQEQAAERSTEFRSDWLMDEFSTYLDQELKHVDFAPVAFATARDHRNVQVVLDLAARLFKQAQMRVGTGQLNQAVEQIFSERTPSTPRGERVKVYYATQTGVAPPEIVLFVNNPDWVSESYQRFIVNRFRELLPYAEVPMKLVLRARSQRNDDEELTKPAPPRRGSAPARKKAKKAARRIPSRPQRKGVQGKAAARKTSKRSRK